MKNLMLILLLIALIASCAISEHEEKTLSEETSEEELNEINAPEKIYYVDTNIIGGWGRVSNSNVGMRFTEDSLMESVFFDSPGLVFGSGKTRFSTVKIGEDTFLELVHENNYGQIDATIYQMYLYKGDTLWLDETRTIENIGMLKGVTIFDQFIKVEE